MRPWLGTAIVLMAFVALGCNGWPLGAGPDSIAINQHAMLCINGPHFQIITADLTSWKTGYPGQEKGMTYPTLTTKTIIRLDTCSGDTWYLRQTDDKKANILSTQWIAVTY